MTYGSRTISNGPTQDNTAIAHAVDTVGGIDYAATKLIDPTEDSTTPIGVAANPLHVQGTVVATLAEPISVDDNGGSLTVDGTVAVSSVGGTVTIVDGGGSITVDGTVSVTEPVSVDDNGGSLTVDGTVAVSSVGGTVAVTQSGVWDEVGINDSGNSITVDNAALSVTGGGVEATALRVTIATDSTGVLSVDDNGGSLTVDNPVLSVVGSGTEATAQRVTIATDSTGVLSVDDNGATLSIDDGAGSITVDNTVLSVVGGGTEATAQRVTIANDSTGVLSVDDNGASLTIDNATLSVTGAGTATGALRTVTASNSPDVTALEIMDDWDESDRAKVNIIVGQAGVQGGSGTVSANTQRVVLATDVALPTGSNTIGSIASIITSVTPGTSAAHLGKAEDAGHTTGDTGVFVLGVRNTANSTLTGADTRYSPIAVDIMSGPISGVRRSSTTLTAINTTYDDSPTSADSATADCSMFRRGSFNAIVTEAGAATDITFTLQFSNDGGTTWFDYRVGPWVKYRFDDATIAAHTSGQLKICEPFECVAPSVRMKVTTTGTDGAGNNFTVASATFEFVN